MPPDAPITDAATFCATVVDEWQRAGLTHAVVCPGSRSTPLAVALIEADGLRAHICLDERSAGFVALGIARATGRPVPVLTTSGTAAVNLHPAVVEAHHDLVPLIACTADRPPELHGVGAPQTIDQQGLYGGAVRRFVDAGVPDGSDAPGWRAVAREVWWAAAGAAVPGREGRAPGPVQLNLPFREPLLGSAGAPPPPDAPDPPDPPDPVVPRVHEHAAASLVSRLEGAKTLVVAGPPMGSDVEGLVSFCARMRWPLLVDPRIACSSGIVSADALLRVSAFADAARPEVVLRLGALPASKVVLQWLDGLDAHQVGIDLWGRRFDPGGSLDQLIAAHPTGWSIDLASLVHGAPEAWYRSWVDAAAVADRVLADQVVGASLTEPSVARIVTEVARDRAVALVVSSSMPIRDVEWFGARGAQVHANRGANGIDGVVSTAAGVALGADRPTIALLGDLAFLHDTNGLLVLHSERPDCTLVVVDNDGGGIFHFLPQARGLRPDVFERLFGTPQGLDVVAVAEAHGIAARRIDSTSGLESYLRSGSGPRCAVVSTDREANVMEHARLHQAVADAIAPDRR